MRLYHFTHPLHLPSILADGRLRTTESNVSFSRARVGPDVVWLIDEPEPDFSGEHSHGLYGAKQQVRFEVEVPGIKWTNWAWAARMTALDRDTLINSGGGIERAEHWYVFPAPIVARRWCSVVDMATGEAIDCALTV